MENRCCILSEGRSRTSFLESTPDSITSRCAFHLILRTSDISPEVLVSNIMCQKWLAVYAPQSAWTM
jgi:hypothetical protein